MRTESLAPPPDSGKTTGTSISTVAGSNVVVPRWAIAILVLAALAAITQWASSPSVAERQVLGFHVRLEAGRQVVSWVQPAGIGWDFQMRPGDSLLTADGTPVTASDDPSRIIQAHTVIFQSGTVVRTATALGNKPTSVTEAIVLWLIAACFAVVGIGVFILSNDLTAASIMLVNGTLGAVLFAQLAPGASADPFNVTTLYLSSVTFGASFLLVAWVFPINRLKTRRGRSLVVISLLPSLALVSAFMLAATVDASIYEWLRRVSYLIHTGNMLGAIGLVLFAMIRPSAEQRAARREVGIVGLGMTIAVLPFVVLLVIPHFLRIPNLVPFEVATLGMVFLPISLGIAITSRQFLGVTRLVRRGLVALIVWLLLIALLSLTVREVGTLPTGGPPLGAENPFLTAILVAIVAIVLWPAQSWLRGQAEAFLFRDVYDFQETLRRLSVEIVEIRGLEAIGHRVLTRLIAVLDLNWAKLELSDDSRTEEIMLFTPNSSFNAHSTRTSNPDLPALIEPLIIEHETIGMLSLGPKRNDVSYHPEDIALVTTLTPMIATALQSALLLRRLEEQVKTLVDREQELAALSGRLMQVQEEERSRLALDLHDDPLQRAILLARELAQTSPEFDRIRLRAETDEIISSLRAICAGLRPPVLDDFGLVAGLGNLVDEARARSELNISINVATHDNAEFGRLDPELETALYRVAQEALNNCIRHANATSVELTLARSADSVTLRVSDNGQGVPTDNPLGDDTSHLGLLGMRERLQPWDGTVSVESSAQRGTEVSVAVPAGRRGE